MKKILISLFLIILSFGFTGSVFAKCTYTAVWGAYRSKNDPATNCKEEVEGTACNYHDGKYRDAELYLDFAKDTFVLSFINDNNEAKTTGEKSVMGNTIQSIAHLKVAGKYPKYIVASTGSEANVLLDRATQAFYTESETKESVIEGTKKFMKGPAFTEHPYNKYQLYFFVLEVDPSCNATGSEEKEEIPTPEYNSCADFTDETSCTSNDSFSCLWITKKMSGKTYNYCNFDDLTYVKCGDSWDVPSRIPGIVSFAVNLLKIAVPIILIIVSVITLIKAVTSQKEDEIKKAQNSLIKKLISAAIVFFIIQITQFVIFKVADSSETDNISTCMSCLLNNDCSKNAYYKVNDPEAKLQGKNYKCKFISSGNEEICN